ncbi:MAG TPA: hypothetical protein VMN57_00930 [Anaerolineales bacterium]|nr:hypothetical protein [Anaerolineales bacterium]
MRSLAISFGVAVMMSLSACQLVGLNPPPDFQATSASMTRIAESVNATQGVIDLRTAQAPTRAPTIERLSFEGAPLSGPVLNVILGIWPLTPQDATVPNTDPLCTAQCVEELWVSLDGRGTMQVGLFEFPNPEQVIAKLRDVRATQDIIGVPELSLPDSVHLPPESWIQDNGGTGSRYTLHTYQGRAVAVLTLYLPDYDPSENILFLALYGERQIEMLKSAGW